ncbi:metalloregulator ArsR/SmtB family transcription factor [Brucepastera parasyntrophica]|uniref:ArsR/SmtB family transcription factor n=1 Tax=Brucepastera parasyntrophica TaxID=2880008 RepID=UPI0021090E59|nr:metalloregulator ArsR/SmtB family transcription factor [Brucepastera parasyntrophica]ULQ60989.1 metalloregulator ArsR/SmtB family transcription factor [Brucepastera parasyntrophica]
MEKAFGEYALLFKVLSDETRLKIFSLLSNDERCACNILEEVNISQPTLSYHMKMLTDCGLVEGRKDGQWMRYTMNESRVKQLEQFLGELTPLPGKKKTDKGKAC